ncbi:MAG: hypothetical protein NVSMB64_20280 [Candidatus Velthaea sp.]
MRLNLRIPQVATSTVETGAKTSRPVLDGSDVVVSNRWNLPPHTVALVGRRAVWFGLDILHWHWEQDFGGHLYLLVTDADATHAAIVEAGPMHANGSGALVPFRYPEDEFAEQKITDFQPEIIPPPNGLSAEFFAELVRTMQREYDGDQRYLAIEIPFFRVGRDSNSYAIGVLLCCGVDPRAIPKGPQNAIHRELTGYPGAEDPVHRANFGVYSGVPTRLQDGVMEVAYHKADGSVLAVVIGGEPHGRARLPDGTQVELDDLGRIAFSPEDARRHRMPSVHTDPPEHIRRRRHFPSDPQAAGARITLVSAGRPVPLSPGDRYRGTIVDRHDALGLATLRTATGDCVLPIADFGVEMRDPERVNALFQVGTELTVGLHRDRHPKLVSHGRAAVGDNLAWRRFHAPRAVNIITTIAVGAVVLAGAAFWWRSQKF